MNQILNIDLNKNVDTDSDIKNSINVLDSSIFVKKNFFKTQFTLSIIAILTIVFSFIYFKYNLSKNEHISTNLISNYNLSKLYSNYLNQSLPEDQYQNPIIGIIEIPNIDLYYPIFAESNDNLLKIAPCRFYGEMPTNSSVFGNLCIAGHNYDNQSFFSNISNLSINDEIHIYNNYGDKFIYYVFQNYEVKSDDLSPIKSSLTNSLELTLITCNNFNSNRIIIKAKTESI